MAVYGASPGKPHRCIERHLRLRFRRPFAAVAVAKSPRQYQHTNGIPVPLPQGPHPWDGVPCFSAWVTRPTEVAPAVPGDVQEPWSELMDPLTAHGNKRMLDWLLRKPV